MQLPIRNVPKSRTAPSSAMPPRNFSVRVPAPSSASIIAAS
jgi:hypothetical protein